VQVYICSFDIRNYINVCVRVLVRSCVFACVRACLCGQYTLGVVVGLGARGHFSTIHNCDLNGGEVEILCDFDSKTGMRIRSLFL